jgi:hypothetical protein
MACSSPRLALTGAFAARLTDALLPDELNLGCLRLWLGLWLAPPQAPQQAS